MSVVTLVQTDLLCCRPMEGQHTRLCAEHTIAHTVPYSAEYLIMIMTVAGLCTYCIILFIVILHSLPAHKEQFAVDSMHVAPGAASYISCLLHLLVASFSRV